MKYRILENTDYKAFTSAEYNYTFNKRTGFFARWGRDEHHDPEMAPVGPEIADIEISTVCSGLGTPCRFCYKANGPVGQNMSLATFSRIFHKFPRGLTQIAFGIGDIDANPDLWAIMRYCRENGENEVIPNVTINGARMMPEYYDNLASLCGAVAVSLYDHDVCYDAVKQLTDRGMRQVNIHCLVSEETYERCRRVVEDATMDPRLAKLNAIVFLALKPKGRGISMTLLKSVRRYRDLIDRALELKVGIGFDSCSAPMFLKAVEHRPDAHQFSTMAEPCESLLFSIYVDVTGRVWPCSFVEGQEFQNINMQHIDTFADVWHNAAVMQWREKLLATATCGMVPGCRECPVCRIYPEVEHENS